MKVEKKRVNIFVDVEKYARFKKLLDIMGVTVTDFMDQTMDDFIMSLESAVAIGDKDVFIKTMAAKVDLIQEQVSEELKK